MFLDLPWVSLCVRPNVQARRLLGKDLMVPKQGLEKAEAACLLLVNHSTFPQQRMPLSLLTLRSSQQSKVWALT